MKNDDPATRERKPQTVEELKAQLEKSNDRLRNSETRIRTLIQTIPVGLLITSEDGVIESGSPVCLHLFGCSYADLHGRSLGELFHFEGKMEEFLSTIDSNQTKEFAARRRDGSEFSAAVKVSSFASFSKPGLLIVVEDVSAKHELEKLKQEFLSMMAHDLRTPLTSIKCFLELVSEGVYDGRIDELKRRSSGIGNDTTRLINMISSLLNIHKLEAGRLQLSMEVIPLSEIIYRSMQSLASWAESRNIPLDVPPAKSGLLVSADGDYTVQVLVNLLSNAIKFSPKGSPVIIAHEVHDDFIKIKVIDKGRGIPKDVQARLFNRFEQARLSDARVEGGSGLGLAISKAIVEEQGGSIGVNSEPGQGCEFWFTLKREIPE
ncbi:MAG TPA: PAS domain S-box protein [Candidatus Melainabacteria bacterium]|nr:PAS domain S-box protein [Candidatus Melainabacteria bacterium]HIN63871.1 PAS domain S-box protein [Candidatus Obscuribacterales bacterium]